MIDNLERTEALMAKLHGALPLRAWVTGDLHQTLRRTSPDAEFSRHCQITEVSYFGDDGGIACHLDFNIQGLKNAHIVSITHLLFDRGSPLTREIRAYQKHRVKRLRKQQGGAY